MGLEEVRERRLALLQLFAVAFLSLLIQFFNFVLQEKSSSINKLSLKALSEQLQTQGHAQQSIFWSALSVLPIGPIRTYEVVGREDNPNADKLSKEIQDQILNGTLDSNEGFRKMADRSQVLESQYRASYNRLVSQLNELDRHGKIWYGLRSICFFAQFILILCLIYEHGKILRFLKQRGG